MRVLSDYIPDPADATTLIPRVCVELGVAAFTSLEFMRHPEVRVIEIDDSYREGAVALGYEEV